MNFPKFDTYFFDCDGVIIDSNQIKSIGFYKVARNFVDEAAAQMFLQYHKANGGISRHEKFLRFQIDFLREAYSQSLQDKLLSLYSEWCEAELRHANFTDGFLEFVTSLDANSLKFVVSGGAENEIKALFQTREIGGFFNEIRGNPTNKIDIMAQLQNKYGNFGKSCFIGDSEYDYLCCKDIVDQFVFMKNYTDFSAHAEYFRFLPNVLTISNLKNLVGPD